MSSKLTKCKLKSNILIWNAKNSAFQHGKKVLYVFLLYLSSGNMEL